MKYLIFLLSFLIYSPSKAVDTSNIELYIDIGGGWIEDIPAKAEAEVEMLGDLQVLLKEKVIVNIDSPFLLISGGIKTKDNWHLELNRFGILDDTRESITTIRLYKRFYIK